MERHIRTGRVFIETHSESEIEAPQTDSSTEEVQESTAVDVFTAPIPAGDFGLKVVSEEHVDMGKKISFPSFRSDPIFRVPINIDKPI